jgi:hypothetical protein
MALFTGRQKELENYCVRMLDEHEDDLTDALKKDAGDLEDILCRNLSQACQHGSNNAGKIYTNKNEL